MKSIVEKATNVALTVQESTALQSLAMLPLQLVPTRVTLTLPFEQLATLLRSIKYQLAATEEEEKNPILHFVSPHKNTGADVIAFELAYVASTQPGKRVLFINTGSNSNLVSRQVQSDTGSTANAVLENGEDDARPFPGAAPETAFFFTTISDPANSERLLPDARDFRKVLENLRKMFDLVVIHSDSALSSQMAVTLYGLTDGGILVIEAENTRVPVAKQLRGVIENHGGRVIGAVLNKRKYYIPRRLYSFLFRA